VIIEHADDRVERSGSDRGVGVEGEQIRGVAATSGEVAGRREAEVVREAISSTSGKSAATISGVPSRESLSTTITCIGTEGGLARRDSRQPRRRSRDR
jgi:hypothetical protein